MSKGADTNDHQPTEPEQIAWDDIDAETQHELVALAETLGSDQPEEDAKAQASRREIIKAAGALGLGAAVGGGSYRAFSQPAAASHGGGSVGTSANPVDLYASLINADGPLEVVGGGGIYSGTIESGFMVSGAAGQDSIIASQNEGADNLYIGAVASDAGLHSTRFESRRARGTVDSPSAVQAGDNTVRVSGHARNGNSGWTEVADIRAQASASPSGGNNEIVPGEIKFRTRDSSDNFATRATVTDSGIDTDSLVAEKIRSDSQLHEVVIWENDAGNVEAIGKDSGVAREDTDFDTVYNGLISDFGRGQYIQIAQGTFLVTSPLSTESAITTQGAGMNMTTLRLADGVDDSMFKDTSSFSSNKLWWTLRDLDLDGNKDNQTAGSGDVVELQPSGSGVYWDVEVERCFIRNGARHGFNSNSGHGYVIRNAPVEFSHQAQVRFSGDTDGRVLFSTIKGGENGVVASNANFVKVGFCQLQGIGQHAIDAAGQTIAVGNEIRGYSQESSDYAGFSAFNADQCVVVGNNIDGASNGKFGVQFGDGATDCIAAGNHIKNVTFSKYRDTGTRNLIDGYGKNGANDPASAGDWNGHGREGVYVKWDDGAGNHYLSVYDQSDGQWWDIALA